MVDETLQAAFEIKTACDEISRKLLRWHWEQKPGAHSLDALLKHLAQRQKESPDYYDRMPDLSGKTSWQQLDTTLCMRVLLDPEKDAAKPPSPSRGVWCPWRPPRPSAHAALRLRCVAWRRFVWLLWCQSSHCRVLLAQPVAVAANASGWPQRIVWSKNLI